MPWVEGIDYEVSKTSEGVEVVKCLHCGRQLQSKAGLGPHLTVCAKPKPERGGGGHTMQVAEVSVPEEKDVLKDILIKFGVKENRAEGIADLMSYAGWDNYGELRYYLDCAGVNPDRVALILKAWSNHRGTAVPHELFKKTKPEKEYESSVFGLYDEFARRELQELMLEDMRMRIEERLEKKRREMEEEKSPYPSSSAPMLSQGVWQQTIAFAALMPFPCYHIREHPQPCIVCPKCLTHMVMGVLPPGIYPCVRCGQPIRYMC
jgi:hypothetical protein